MLTDDVIPTFRVDLSPFIFRANQSQQCEDASAMILRNGSVTSQLVMRLITTFRSTTDCIYDGGPRSL
jgi:hypothetical protein